MTSLTLTALPAHHEQEDGCAYTVTVVELLGDCLGRERVEAKSIADTTARVKSFGDTVAGQHPDRSFRIVVSPAKGSRKFGGFDAANRQSQFGQDAWVKTVHKPSRSCGSAARAS